MNAIMTKTIITVSTIQNRGNKDMRLLKHDDHSRVFVNEKRGIKLWRTLELI